MSYIIRFGPIPSILDLRGPTIFQYTQLDCRPHLIFEKAVFSFDYRTLAFSNINFRIVIRIGHDA
eukprot:SAG22_NODE_1033_length_5921_cov_9.527482_4_plen_65_part_00